MKKRLNEVKGRFRAVDQTDSARHRVARPRDIFRLPGSHSQYTHSKAKDTQSNAHCAHSREWCGATFSRLRS